MRFLNTLLVMAILVVSITYARRRSRINNRFNIVQSGRQQRRGDRQRRRQSNMFKSSRSRRGRFRFNRPLRGTLPNISTDSPNISTNFPIISTNFPIISTNISSSSSNATDVKQAECIEDAPTTCENDPSISSPFRTVQEYFECCTDFMNTCMKVYESKTRLTDLKACINRVHYEVFCYNGHCQTVAFNVPYCNLL